MAGLCQLQTEDLLRERMATLSWFTVGARTVLVEALGRAAQGEAVGPIELETTLVGPPPQVVALRAAAATGPEGRPCVLAGFTDVTQERYLREKLRLSQKLEAVGRLASGLAHDYNNVLTVIKGYSEVMLLNPAVPPDVGRQIRSMATAAERGAQLTRQLLTFSRRQTLQFRPLDLNEVVSNITQMLRRLVGENVGLQLKYAPNLPTVCGDLGMLEQVISNLVLHARDQMGGGGQLRIATEVLCSDTKTVAAQDVGSGTWVCLSLTDSGPGMDEPTRARLFEPMASVPGTEYYPRLGIHIANAVVQQHQGRIEVVSAPDKGTTFRVLLPASAEGLRRAEEGGSERPPGGTETVLVVEDEPSIRELMRSILAGYGYEVLEAGSGPEAQAVWQQQAHRIAMLFTDVVMPGGMTGIALAQRLQESKPGLKVLFTTGYSIDLVQAGVPLRAGVNLLPKPFSASSLLVAVRRCLDRPA
jgi:signal transduction histidine kinase